MPARQTIWLVKRWLRNSISDMAMLDEAVSRFQADMLIAMLKSDAYAYQRQVRGLTQEQLISKIESLFLDDKK